MIQELKTKPGKYRIFYRLFTKSFRKNIRHYQTTKCVFNSLIIDVCKHIMNKLCVSLYFSRAFYIDPFLIANIITKQ